ncbi:MAG: putative metalloprotease CJM1_0395 family protein [Pseudomonadota bacterium]
MLATPAISSTPLHNARLHSRPPGGIDPQVLPEIERQARTTDRNRPQRVQEADRSDRTGQSLNRPTDGTSPERQARAPEGTDPTRGESQTEEELRPGADPDPADRAEVDRLEERDRRVRAHEAAHVQAGAPYAGTPRYDYVVGPDGRRYAVGGRVQIDMSTDPSDPEATIRKMQTVKRAALAPVDPSPADRQVAALAERLSRAAEADLTALRAAEREVLAAAQSDRLTRLAILYAQTAVLPAPDPTTSRAA